MKYYIYEEATYQVDADSPWEALVKFKLNLRYPFGVEVLERIVYDKDGNNVTKESGDE